MAKIQSLSGERIIVEVDCGSGKLPMLVDTGASVALLDRDAAKRNGIERGARYAGRLVGASGEFDAWHCRALFSIGGRPFGQFLIADIGSVIESVERETGVRIGGILSLPQMKSLGMRIDARAMEVEV